MSSCHLAQLNIATLVAPLDSPLLTDFVASLDRINALADQAQGFVWRLQTDDGDATGIRYFGEDVIVNMSLWESVESLHDYVYRSSHIDVMRRRAEWFKRSAVPYTVLWWVPAGHRPSLEEAGARLQYLQRYGPTAKAFTFKKRFAAPGSGVAGQALDGGSPCPIVPPSTAGVE